MKVVLNADEVAEAVIVWLLSKGHTVPEWTVEFDWIGKKDFSASVQVEN